jgi:hypothetical protein
MLLQDYEMGHIFLYDRDKLLIDYVKGDLFKYPDGDLWHAPVNVGKNYRYSFNFTCFGYK